MGRVRALGGGRKRRAIIINGLLAFSKVRVPISSVLCSRLRVDGLEEALRGSSSRCAPFETPVRVCFRCATSTSSRADRLNCWSAYLYALSIRGDFHLGIASSVPDIRTVLCDADLAARTKVFEFKAWPQALWVIEIVEAALRRYPLRQPSTITPELMTVLFGRTHGLPGRVFGMLKAAAAHAINSGSEQITAETLRAAEPPFSNMAPRKKTKGAGS